MVLKRIFGPKTEKVPGGQRYIMGIFIIYTLHKILIIRVIKLRWMRWAAHMARMGM